MESIEARDILLLVVGWVISKVLDALFGKAKERVTRNQKKKPPQRKQHKRRKRR